MDEDQFRAVYRELNTQRCVFEKAMNNRRCDCRHKRPFLLATREGVGCHSAKSLQQCTTFLNTLRDGSRFALRETFIDGPLPHNKELKVQAGGCHALQDALFPEQTAPTAMPDAMPDIDALVSAGLVRYGSIENFPYSDLVRGVLNYQSRRQRRGG